MPKLVYDFTEGNKDLKDLLGGKGANLAEMTNIGLPVPPGFTITTEACRYYLEHGSTPAGLDEEIAAHLAKLEEIGYISGKTILMGRRPKTTYRLTAAGRRALDAYLESMRRLLDAVEATRREKRG